MVGLNIVPINVGWKTIMKKEEVKRIINSGDKEEIAKALMSYWKRHGSSYQKALDIFFSDESPT